MESIRFDDDEPLEPEAPEPVEVHDEDDPPGNRPASGARQATPAEVFSEEWQRSGLGSDFLGLDDEVGPIGELAPERTQLSLEDAPSETEPPGIHALLGAEDEGDPRDHEDSGYDEASGELGAALDDDLATAEAAVAAEFAGEFGAEFGEPEGSGEADGAIDELGGDDELFGELLPEDEPSSPLRRVALMVGAAFALGAVVTIGTKYFGGGGPETTPVARTSAPPVSTPDPEIAPLPPEMAADPAATAPPPEVAADPAATTPPPDVAPDPTGPSAAWPVLSGGGPLALAALHPLGGLLPLLLGPDALPDPAFPIELVSADGPEGLPDGVLGIEAPVEITHAGELALKHLELLDPNGRPVVEDGPSDLSLIWRGREVPMVAISAANQLLTPAVGGVRLLLDSGEVFEGRLYAVGHDRVWLDTALGRMALDGQRVDSIQRVEVEEGSTAGDGQPALLPGDRVRVRTVGGVLYGRILVTKGDKVSLMTDSGGRITLTDPDIEAVGTGSGVVFRP